MAEFKKQIGVGVMLSIIAAISIGLLAVTLFPSGTETTSTSIPTPAPLLGEVSAINVTCSISAATCSMTLVNNSTTALRLDSCLISVISSSNQTATTWGVAQGTIGGPATAGVPAAAKVVATCTVPMSQLSHMTNGSLATGGFKVTLVDRWYSYAAGTQTNIDFQGTWS